MKKLIIVTAIDLAAFASNAAAFTWKTSISGNAYTPGDDTAVLSTGMAYLFDSATVTQQAILTAFDATGSIGSLANLDTHEVSSGAISSGNTVTINEGSAYTLNALVAIIATVDEKDYLFISDITSKNGAATGTAQISLNFADASKGSVTEFKAGSATFGSSGWYTQSVPEPTSGLLILLGMAGLALRRRRA